jgi:hypothetical protein
MKNKLIWYDSELKMLHSKLRETEKVEMKRQKLLSLLNESSTLLSFLKQRLLDFRVLQEIVGKEEVSFKQRRLSYLDGNITENLQYIFPKKSLYAKTSCNFDRKNMKLHLSLVDTKGYIRPAYLTEGKFAQQLISFTAAKSCTKLLGKDKLYLDEAFSNSSEDNLLKMQKLLQESVNEGFQIILISQSNLLFSDISHHEIVLNSSNGEFIDSVKYVDF